MDKDYIIYVLELEDNKFYIGRSTNHLERIEQHIRGEGAEFTKKYKVKKLREVIETKDKFDEDKITKKYMSQYGILNVRGGTYTTLEFSEEIINILQKEIYGSEDRCYYCGSKFHFQNNCKDRYKKNKNNDINKKNIDEIENKKEELIIDIIGDISKDINTYIYNESKSFFIKMRSDIREFIYKK